MKEIRFMKNYTKILSLFTGNDQYRDWMNKPFYHENNVIATDAMSMVIIPYKIDATESDVYNKCGWPGFEDWIKENIPDKGNISYDLPVAEIKQAFEKHNCFSDYNCEACDGIGSVLYFFGHEGKSFEHRHECPICDGEGKFSNDKKKMVLIKDAYFSVWNIQKLISTADIAEEKITMTFYDTPSKPVFFEIGTVKCFLAPVLGNNVAATDIVFKCEL